MVAEYCCRLAGFLLLFVLGGLTPTHAEEAVEPLLESTVAAAAKVHFPKVLEALAKVAAARGSALATRGNFDLVFASKGFKRSSGFYNGAAADAQFTQPLRAFGADLFAGYKLSNGSFPVYEDGNFTNTGGQASVGVLFSLLKDRAIDERRFSLADAELALRQRALELLLTRVGVQQQALSAYWGWVAAGRQLKVYQELLTLALTREGGLVRQVAAGARARIFLTENEQNIMRRRMLVKNAEADYQLAANRLGFYLRDKHGEPTQPLLGALPPAASQATFEKLNAVTADGAAAALASRPELASLRVGMERAKRRIALKRNALQPKLDLKLERMHPFGSLAEGGASRDSVDTVVGLSFEVPLQRRKARGELAAEEAKRDALAQETRLVEDTIALEIENLLVRLHVARDLLDLAVKEVELSDTMRRAEVKRFDSGASDFFLVNLREETAFNARVRLLTAELALRRARLVYDAATVDLPRLGLGTADR